MSAVIAAGVVEARALVDALDRALVAGLARLGPESQDALQRAGQALLGSPLGEAYGGAVEALRRGELLAQHLGLLAAGRAALEGAIADAALATMAAHAGLVLEAPSVEAPAALDAKSHRLMEGARQWLVEIGLAGLGQLELATISPALASLRALQEHPPLRRLAALMTGFAHELMDSAPTAGLEHLPARRWADLWTTALLATFAPPERATRRTVRARLTPLGADLRHHDHLISAVVHGLLEEPGAPRRLVRVTVSAWKVDAIAGPELFTLLQPLAPPLFACLDTPQVLELTDTTLLSSGELLWDGTCKAAGPADPYAVELTGATLCMPLPRDRHVLQLAVPVTGRGALPAEPPTDLARVSRLAGIESLEGTKGYVALLRFDEALSLQPLALGLKKGSRGPGEGLRAAAKLKDRASAVLAERASRLLRKS
jgi:hypothetical protein